jgi:hypothetical protein
MIPDGMHSSVVSPLTIAARTGECSFTLNHVNVNPYVSGSRDNSATRLGNRAICTLGTRPEKVEAAIEHKLGILPMIPDASCRLLVLPLI